MTNALLVLATAIAVAQAALLRPLSLARPRGGFVTMSDETQCALIDLSTSDADRLAKVIKSCWKEGGMKRGLSGTVLVPEQDLVRIVCSGPTSRLKAFAEYIETSSQLVSGVKLIQSDECPTDAPMTEKFPLAPVEAGEVPEWRELVNQATLDLSASQGKTHSSDEGLA